jgi:two-component system, NarL family, response regulator LiaR
VRTTRILVADSATVLRVAVRTVLDSEKDFVVVEARDLADVESAAASEVPDVALVDLDLPPRGGIAAVKELVAAGCRETIVWGFRSDRALVFAAIRAGAKGFLHKEISPQGLVRALRGAARGEAPLSRDLVSLVIDAVHNMDVGERARERTSSLSGREREVLGLVADGARNKQIASTLAISEFTVKRHVQNILQKLELPTRHAAAAYYDAALATEESA